MRRNLALSCEESSLVEPGFMAHTQIVNFIVVYSLIDCFLYAIDAISQVEEGWEGALFEIIYIK
jgi:hypothetical protein